MMILGDAEPEDGYQRIAQPGANPAMHAADPAAA